MPFPFSFFVSMILKYKNIYALQTIYKTLVVCLNGLSASIRHVANLSVFSSWTQKYFHIEFEEEKNEIEGY